MTNGIKQSWIKLNPRNRIRHREVGYFEKLHTFLQVLGWPKFSTWFKNMTNIHKSHHIKLLNVKHDLQIINWIPAHHIWYFKHKMEYANVSQGSKWTIPRSGNKMEIIQASEWIIVTNAYCRIPMRHMKTGRVLAFNCMDITTKQN